MSIIELLASDNFITVNKSLVKVVGLEAAVFFGNLASEYKYWDDRDELNDGFFFSTVENVEDKTGLSSYQQRQAVNKLEEVGLIEVQKKGIPARRYIRIIESQVTKILHDKKLKKCTTGGKKITQQEVKKLHSNNNINNNRREQEYSKKERKSEVPALTFDEILDSVPVIANNTDLRETFIDFIKMRKLIKKPLTDRALKGIVNKAYELGKGEPDQMIKVLEQSIEGSWQGLYELKEEPKKPKREKTLQELIDEGVFDD